MGTLCVARDRDEAEALDRLAEFRRGLGLPVERLRPSQARRLEPALAPTVRLALDIASDHSVDPRLLVAALRRKVTHIWDAARATALKVEGDRVTGVITPEGTVLADKVVVATGVDSAKLDMPDAARVPVRPVKGQVLRLRDPNGPGLVERTIRGEQAYFVPRGDGRYVLGATMEERGWDVQPTAGGVYELLRDLSELVPGVFELEIEELIAGLRPATPDNLPAIGPGTLDGLVWATGHFRNGILLDARHRRPRRGRARRRVAAGLGRARQPPTLRRSGRMNVVLNGEPRELARRRHGRGRLEALDLPGAGRGVAVAVDAEVVPRGQWGKTTLHEGARVEILRAIQGG